MEEHGDCLVIQLCFFHRVVEIAEPAVRGMGPAVRRFRRLLRGLAGGVVDELLHLRVGHDFRHFFAKDVLDLPAGFLEFRAGRVGLVVRILVLVIVLERIEVGVERGAVKIRVGFLFLRFGISIRVPDIRIAGPSVFLPIRCTKTYRSLAFIFTYYAIIHRKSKDLLRG